MPTTFTPNPAAVSLDPGWLFAAPIGTAEPTAASTDLGSTSPWVNIGYTDQGSSFAWNLTTSEIEVAESFDVIAYRTTKREGSLSFAMAEIDKRHLSLALNKGIVANDGTAIEPADPGQEVRVMLALATASGALWIFRRCYNGGSTQIDNQKAPQKRLLAVQFNLEVPLDGKRPFVTIPNASTFAV